MMTLCSFANPHNASQPMSSKQSSRIFFRSLLAALVVFAGCDLGGQYEARFAKALTESGQRAHFDKNLYPTEIEEIKDAAGTATGVKLRLPKLFDGESKSLPATEARAQPPLGAIPGLTYALERQIDDNQEGEKKQFLPVYAYFAAVPKTDQKADALQAALQQQFGAALPGAAWGDAILATPDGQSVPLKRLRGNGQQEFMNLQVNPPKPVRVDGRFDLYLIDAPAHHVLIGWRAPKAQSDKYEFEAATEAAMGTVSIAADPAAAPPAAP